MAPTFAAHDAEFAPFFFDPKTIPQQQAVHVVQTDMWTTLGHTKPNSHNTKENKAALGPPPLLRTRGDSVSGLLTRATLPVQGGECNARPPAPHSEPGSRVCLADPHSQPARASCRTCVAKR